MLTIFFILIILAIFMTYFLAKKIENLWPGDIVALVVACEVFLPLVLLVCLIHDYQLSDSKPVMLLLGTLWLGFPTLGLIIVSVFDKGNFSIPDVNLPVSVKLLIEVLSVISSILGIIGFIAHN